jgi:hypothetical protein
MKKTGFNIYKILILFSFILLLYAFSNTSIGLKLKNPALKTINSLFMTINKDQLIVYKNNDNKLDIYSLLPDKNILITKFSKKKWGTWNIDGWFIDDNGSIPTNSSHMLAGCGTDWEYVFRVKDNKKDVSSFSGGNHGKELLCNIKFLNGDNNSEICKFTGKQYKLKTLRILENTSLTLDENQTKKFADVKRIYTIYPTKIKLNTILTFTRDVYMDTSYVCMFPVTKDNGRHIKFNDTNNIYTTPQYGQTLSIQNNHNYLGKEKTLSAQIWGDSLANYKFPLSIKNEEMVDSFKNELKVFYWDLNKSVNKLYFSKYNFSEHRVIKSGTIWNNTAEWELALK